MALRVASLERVGKDAAIMHDEEGATPSLKSHGISYADDYLNKLVQRFFLHYDDDMSSEDCHEWSDDCSLDDVCRVNCRCSGCRVNCSVNGVLPFTRKQGWPRCPPLGNSPARRGVQRGWEARAVGAVGP